MSTSHPYGTSQTVGELRAALAAAEGAARVASWARDAAERRADAAEAAAAAAGVTPTNQQRSAPAADALPAQLLAQHCAAAVTTGGQEPGVGCGDAAALAQAQQSVSELRRQLADASAELEERQVRSLPLVF